VRKALAISLACLALLSLMATAWAQEPTPTVTPTTEGKVCALFFYSFQCPHCINVIKGFLPDVLKRYGERLDLRGLEISDSLNYSLFLVLEDAYKIPPQRRGIPVIFIGEEVLIGEREIREHFEEVVDRYLAQGGKECPIPEGLIVAVTPTPPPVKPVVMAYFYQAGCRECDRAEYDLEFLRRKYPHLAVESFSVDKNAALAEWLGERYGVPKEKRLTAPAVFVGDDYLLGEEVNFRNLEALVLKYSSQGAEPIWHGWEKEREEAERSIVERFSSFGALTILAAGLLDGVNPCAFATIIFFISYLALLGRKGREILLVGLSFTLGVFMTYLGIGTGLLKFLQTLPFLDILGRWVYLATAILCLVLAVLSFRDYLTARRGKTTDMVLRLPKAITRQVHEAVRKGTSVRGYSAAAFITGFVVSWLELACTGQVYLPTIIFVMSLPALRARAFAYLLLYNLCFVLPLVVVFLLAFYGTTSQELARFARKRTALVKLLTSGLFLALAGWLIYVLM